MASYTMAGQLGTAWPVRHCLASEAMADWQMIAMCLAVGSAATHGANRLAQSLDVLADLL